MATTIAKAKVENWDVAIVANQAGDYGHDNDLRGHPPIDRHHDNEFGSAGIG